MPTPKETVTRIPRVWFYCRSLTYPRLMDRYFSHLKLKKRLNYTWHLCITHSDADNADTAFSIEPDLTYVVRPSLGLLQRDCTHGLFLGLSTAPVETLTVRGFIQLGA